MRRLLALTALVSGALLAPAAAHAGAGDVLVRYAPGTPAAERADARQDAGVRHDAALPLRGAEVVDPAPGVTVGDAVAALEARDDVLYAEPDGVIRRSVTPNDPGFADQWGLPAIRAPEAWDVTTGTPGVVVAVIDSGMDAGHPDLAPNVWTNAGETAGDGDDDDGNGLVDDVHGWDWVQADDDPDDLDGHGTHVAGTVGARGGDGAGVTGVAWSTSLLPLRVIGAAGTGRVSDAIRAYAYAQAKGARVANLSFGGQPFSQAERDALAAASDVLFVVAAGNESADLDAAPSYPCDYAVANVVCVGATTTAGALAGFSNRGGSVDLAAPGAGIVSTFPGGLFATLDGTSMAAPHVSGAAALVAAQRPSAGPAELRRMLLESAAPVPGLAGLTATGGLLDVAAALSLAAVPVQRTAQVPVAAPEPARTPVAVSQSSRSLPVVDRTGPTLRLSSARGDLRRFLRKGLRLRVRCSEACSLGAEAVLGGRRVAFAEGERDEAGRVTLRLRPTRAARKRLAHARLVRLTVRVTGVDGAGNDRTRSLQLVLRR